MTLLIMMLFLAGCVVGPDYERSQLFSDSLIEKSLGIAASTEKFTGDFQNFHDDTLNNLITVGLKNNLTIRQAIAALREARYALRSEQAGLFPTLDALGQYQKIKNSKNTVLAVSSDSYQVGLDAGWEIDIFGHQQRKIEQSAAAANKAIANLKNVLVSLCAEIALTYYDLRLNQVLLEKTKENVVINQE